MICPYCSLAIYLDITIEKVYPDNNCKTNKTGKEIIHGFCPHCNELIILVKTGNYEWEENHKNGVILSENEKIIFPTRINHVFHEAIPTAYREAYNESNSVLSISPKASAALSRRLLQQILIDEYGINKSSLFTQIEEFLKLPNLPSELSQSIDAIRNIGNFAAHPNKYITTGEIVDVEDGEADWLLSVIKFLFTYTFVIPYQEKTNINLLNKKLIALGKPPLKSSK